MPGIVIFCRVDTNFARLAGQFFGFLKILELNLNLFFYSNKASDDITKNPRITINARCFVWWSALSSPGSSSQNVTKNIVPAPKPWIMDGKW